MNLSTAERQILRQTKPVILLGMHRSGTSLTARLLQDAGIFMGDHLTVNEEPPTFQQINRRIFSNAGAGWSNVAPVIKSMGSHQFIERQLAGISEQLFAQGTIIQFLGSERWQELLQTKTPIWGWKDPYTTITFPIWLEIFPQARIVHIIRNGIDVAISMHRRTVKVKRQWWKWWWYQLKGYGSSTLNFNHCFRLWEAYVSFVLEQKVRFLPGQYFEMHYEDLLAEPEDQLQRLFDFLALSVDQNQLQSSLSKINQGRLNNAQRAVQYRDQIPGLINSALMSRLGYSYSLEILHSLDSS
jgi:hypothetical protein